MAAPLAGKVALVTGAASGIGLACAARVVLADVNESAGADAVATLVPQDRHSAQCGSTVLGLESRNLRDPTVERRQVVT